MLVGELWSEGVIEINRRCDGKVERQASACRHMLRRAAVCGGRWMVTNSSG